MNIFKYTCLLVFLSLMSCVPTKDLIYLQNNGNGESVQAINPVASKPYRVQTNDIINIAIKGIDPILMAMFNPNEASGANLTETNLYFNAYTVDDHGNIRMPLLGTISVMGLTLEETRIKIEDQLLTNFFNKEANIYVNVKLAGFRYTINGEVTQPGSKILMQEKVNILEAIANSGDITVTGDRKSVAVIRQFPHGTEIHTLDLTDISAMQSPYYYLQPNDYIYVKPLPQKAWGTGTTGIQSFTTIISVMTLVTTTILLFIK